MPSKKPLIALRLDMSLHSMLVAAAQRDGRSPANFIEFHIAPIVRRLDVGAVHDAALKAGVHPRQVHIEDAIAAIVKRGPVLAKAKRSAKHK